MRLTKRDMARLTRLLALLQDHLESAIETALVPGTNQPDPRDEAQVRQVQRDRRDWREAEDYVRKLEAMRKA